MQGGSGKGRKKKKRVIEEEMREEWSQHGDAKVEVWQKRYGKFMKEGREEEEFAQ